MYLGYVFPPQKNSFPIIWSLDSTWGDPFPLNWSHPVPTIMLRTPTLHYPLLQNYHPQNLTLITSLQLQQNNIINYKHQYITQSSTYILHNYCVNINTSQILLHYLTKTLHYFKTILFSPISTLISTWTDRHVPQNTNHPSSFIISNNSFKILLH